MFENSFKRLNFMKKNQACYASKNAQLKKGRKNPPKHRAKAVQAFVRRDCIDGEPEIDAR